MTVKKVQDLSVDVIRCRAFSHSWAPYTAKFQGKKKGYNVTLVCNRCDCEKHFMLSQRGEYGRPVYNYPAEYLMDHPVTQAERNQIKWEACQEVITNAITEIMIRTKGETA